MGPILEPSEPFTITASPARMASKHGRFQPRRRLGIAAPGARGKSLPQRVHQRPATEHEVDPGGLDRLRKFAMQIGPWRPEFQHVAEHGDAPAALPDRRLAEQRDRRAHRRRVGVVAFVDQQGGAAGDRESERAHRARSPA